MKKKHQYRKKQQQQQQQQQKKQKQGERIIIAKRAHNTPGYSASLSASHFSTRAMDYALSASFQADVRPLLDIVDQIRNSGLEDDK